MSEKDQNTLFQKCVKQPRTTFNQFAFSTIYVVRSSIHDELANFETIKKKYDGAVAAWAQSVSKEMEAIRTVPFPELSNALKVSFERIQKRSVQRINTWWDLLSSLVRFYLPCTMSPQQTWALLKGGFENKDADISKLQEFVQHASPDDQKKLESDPDGSEILRRVLFRDYVPPRDEPWSKGIFQILEQFKANDNVRRHLLAFRPVSPKTDYELLRSVWVNFHMDGKLSSGCIEKLQLLVSMEFASYVRPVFEFLRDSSTFKNHVSVRYFVPF